VMQARADDVKDAALDPRHGALLNEALLFAKSVPNGSIIDWLCRDSAQEERTFGQHLLDFLNKDSMERSFGKVDLNTDHEVDMVEWKAAGGTQEDFDVADTNHDHKLSVEEYAAYHANPLTDSTEETVGLSPKSGEARSSTSPGAELFAQKAADNLAAAPLLSHVEPAAIFKENSYGQWLYFLATSPPAEVHAYKHIVRAASHTWDDSDDEDGESDPEKDNRQPNETKTMAAAHMWSEFVGMTLFVFVGAGSAVNGGSTLQVALTFGLAIFVLAVALGHHSGGQMNCAVTLALVIVEELPPLQGALNVVAQILGSITGALLLWAVFPSDMDQTGSLGSNMLSSGYGAGSAFVGEVLCTFLLVFVVLEAAVNPAYKGTCATLAIGAAVFLAHSIMIAVDGCSINPTRSFGTAIVASMRGHGKSAGAIWEDHWIFWLGPLIGASLAALMERRWWAYLEDHKKMEAKKRMREKRDAAVADEDACVGVPQMGDVAGGGSFDIDVKHQVGDPEEEGPGEDAAGAGVADVPVDVAASADVAATSTDDAQGAEDVEQGFKVDRALVEDYFARYDLDESGTLNSAVELKQISVNLIYALVKDGKVDAIARSVIMAAIDAVAISDENAWDVGNFTEWFESFINDNMEEDSEDDSDGE